MIRLLSTMGILMMLQQVACSRGGIRVPEPGKLRPGDLVFQKLDCGDLCEAIIRATAVQGVPEVSHVAVVEEIRGKEVILIEAYNNGVARIPLEEFSRRTAPGKNRVIVGRLKPPHDALIPFFLHEVRARIGKPYDPFFLPENGSYYCSELISDAFLSLGSSIFPRQPMSFGKPGTTEFAIWENYYKKAGMRIPQGEPGTNPIQILASPFLEILR